MCMPTMQIVVLTQYTLICIIKKVDSMLSLIHIYVLSCRILSTYLPVEDRLLQGILS